MRKISIIMQDESAQGVIEYGLLLGLVAVAAIASLLLLGPKISSLFTVSEESIPSWVTEQASPSCSTQ